MALQGTIDTFPLADVLALLASSSRSGRLTLAGDRGRGTVWIDDGLVVGGELAAGDIVDPTRILFDLLRFTDGSFEFEAVERARFPTFDSGPSAVVECLHEARRMVAEWARIEAIVPSPAHRVDLASELPSPEYTIDRGVWRVLVAISRSSSVADLAAELDVSEHDATVLVASMVEEGIVEVSEPWDLDALLADPLSTGVGDSPETGAGTSGPDGTAIDANEALQPAIDLTPTGDRLDPSAFPDHFPIDDLIAEGGSDGGDTWSLPLAEHSDTTGPGADAIPAFLVEPDPQDRGMGGGLTPSDEWDALVGAHGAASSNDIDDPTEEVLRQMSKLSPEAAEAIAAALEAVDPADGRGPGAVTPELFGDAGTPDHRDQKGHASADGSEQHPELDRPGGPETGPISYLDSF